MFGFRDADSIVGDLYDFQHCNARELRAVSFSSL